MCYEIILLVKLDVRAACSKMKHGIIGCNILCSLTQLLHVIDDVSLLGYDAVSLGLCVLMFPMNVVPSSSVVKVFQKNHQPQLDLNPQLNHYGTLRGCSETFSA
jgi:hypothetical protein